MTVRNEIMLITYADSMGRNLKELSFVLARYFRGAIGGIHILPFFPSSADRGFAPLTYQEVDERFGTWRDLAELGRDYYLMYDFMINHLSRQSQFFQDFVRNGDSSPYATLFIRYKDFWPKGEPTDEELSLIYKRKPRPPYVDVAFANGTKEKIWCTFGDEQIDLNLSSDVGRRFVLDSLTYLAGKGPSLIRLDAFAYAVKKPGTNCFFIEPDVWELLDFTQSLLKPHGVEILPEVHEHYTIQLKLAERGYWVYDFALPMLLLYSLYKGSGSNLKNWLRMCPKKQFTTLDTHDGIGVVDVKGLLSEDQIEETKNYIYLRGKNVQKLYNTMVYNNLDIYQINCTYYSALGNDDDAYLLARAIQFFAPGIPQVYYVGLLAGENDIALLEQTKEGRNINRHYYTLEEIETSVKRPIVRRLLNLMRFRNSYPAFGGDHRIGDTTDETLEITWSKKPYEAVLDANLRTHALSIRYYDPLSKTQKTLEGI